MPSKPPVVFPQEQQLLAHLCDPGATMGSYLRVLATLGLEKDLDGLAADDKVGRRLQDLALEPRATSPRRLRGAAKPVPPDAEQPP